MLLCVFGFVCVGVVWVCIVCVYCVWVCMLCAWCCVGVCVVCRVLCVGFSEESALFSSADFGVTVALSSIIAWFCLRFRERCYLFSPLFALPVGQNKLTHKTVAEHFHSALSSVRLCD